MGAPAIFEEQIEIKLLHPASTDEVTDSGLFNVKHSKLARVCLTAARSSSPETDPTTHESQRCTC
ncbi:MAG: hypothetical protein P8X89_18625 [Reinekea sp.]